MSLGQNVKWRRLALGMNQTELARRIRVHRRAPDRSYISRLEAGKVDPPASVIRSLAKALCCKPWQLLAETYSNADWWEKYLALAPQHKREIQRLVRWYSEGRGRWNQC